MSIFAQLQNQATKVKTEDKDFTGKYTVDSGLYPAKIRVMYIDKSQSGAAFVAIDAILTIDGKQRQYKENIFISNKEGGLTYKDKNGEDQPLPGYQTIDTLIKSATGKSFAEVTTEVKQIKVRNPQTRQDEPMPKEIIMDMIDAQVQLGITETKEVHYNDPSKTQLKNQIHKVFNADGFTLTELAAQATEPKYATTWAEQFTGKQIDNTAGKANQGRPAQSGAPQAKPATSLF